MVRPAVSLAVPPITVDRGTGISLRDRQQQCQWLQMRRSSTGTATPTNLHSSVPSDVSYSSSTVDALKADLIRACTSASSSSSKKPDLDTIRMMVRELEDTAEEMGIGQASSLSGFLSGEWYVKV
jgi:hypothetical protein